MTKYPYLLLLIFFISSCKTPTQRWIDGLSSFKELHSRFFNLEVMKIAPAAKDTTSLNYKIRIYPSSQWISSHDNEAQSFFYTMDSCFFLRADKISLRPTYFQPVNNGISNCYEYLVSFEIGQVIKAKAVQLIYNDKLLDGKRYSMVLNQ